MICGSPSCGRPFTQVDVEFAVEIGGRRYHAGCVPGQPEPDPHERDDHAQRRRDHEGPFEPGTIQPRIRQSR